MEENEGRVATCQKFNAIRHNMQLLQNFPKLKLGTYTETTIISTMHVMEWEYTTNTMLLGIR